MCRALASCDGVFCTGQSGEEHVEGGRESVIIRGRGGGDRGTWLKVASITASGVYMNITGTLTCMHTTSIIRLHVLLSSLYRITSALLATTT